MIIRILGEGQRDVPESALEELNRLDAAVEKAVADNDEAAFATALPALIDGVRKAGAELPHEELRESDLVLPPADGTLDEVRALLQDDGLIPG